MSLTLIRTDIVRVHADAIVNAANSALAPGGGVCGAIFAAAGYDKLERACRSIGHCDVGGAVITPGFRLPARYVIHAVGPVWMGGGHHERELLRSAYHSALTLAIKHRCKSIAFPLISAGIYGYPKQEAFRVAVSTIQDFLMEHDLEVSLILFDSSSVLLGETLYQRIQSYIDDHYVEERKSRRFPDFLFQRRQIEEQRSAQMPREEPEEDLFDASFADAREEPEEDLFDASFADAREEPSAGAAPWESADWTEAPNAPDGFAAAAPPYEAEDEPRFAASRPKSTPRPAPRPAAPGRKWDEDTGRLPSPGRVFSARSLENLVNHLDESFSQMLLRLIDKKGMTDVEVYKRANLDRKLFSKLRKSSYRPGKQTAVALAIALRLNLDETTDLLARAGYALSPCSRADVIVRYFIEEGIYDIFAVNEALFSFGEKLLGA